MLKVSAISHTYDRTASPVLHDVSFSFPSESGIVALLGASGSGKSTLLNIIGGALKPTDGSVTLDVSPSDVAWLFQTPNVLMHRSAIDNVAIGIAGRMTWQSAKAKAAEALDVYGLRGREDAPARTLSGGETQRLVLARAQVAAAKVLLTDEPTGQLDLENTKLVIRSLRTLSDAGTLVVVASHDALVADAADLRIKIESGRSVRVDS